MLLVDAAVLDDDQAGVGGQPGGGVVDHPLLKPEAAGLVSDSLPGDGGGRVGSAEHVHDVHRFEQRVFDTELELVGVANVQPALQEQLRGDGGPIDKSPLAPSTMTARASAAVGPTSAMRRALPASTCARTYSAPVRVLPKPRPASSSQTRQSPDGGFCEALASRVQS